MARVTNRKQLVTSLTVDDLRQMITEIVRQVVREETQRAYYVKDGIKILYEEEAVDPAYARELNEHYAAITDGKEELVSREQIEKELRDLGVPL